MISRLKTQVLTVLFSATMLFLTACATGQKTSNDISAGSVMITNTKGNHGGTGIVLRSGPTESLVLTNSHVCGVVENGGVVSGRAGQFMVSGYKHSEHHDLCLLKVEGDLRHNTKIANRPPVDYYERVAVSGHPALLPNVKTYGHFSGRERIPIMIGMRQCTAEDAKDQRKAFLCFFVGGIPIIKMYQSQLVTATIMPGSSGSGVYNKDMELSGVVFAGQSQLGYGWIVPYESMKNFLRVEQHHLEFQTPKNLVDIFEGGGEEAQQVPQSEAVEKLRTACNSPNREKISRLCGLLESDLIK